MHNWPSFSIYILIQALDTNFLWLLTQLTSFVEKKITQASLLILYVPHNPYKFIEDARYL